MKVMVRQWPCGVLPISFLPRGAEPRIGVILVDAASIIPRMIGLTLASRRRTPVVADQAGPGTASTALVAWR